MADMKRNDQNQPQVPMRQQGGMPARQQSRGDIYRNPFQVMREFMRDPFGTMMPGSDLAVNMEVRETEDAFVFKADLPGMKKEDIDISLHANRLTISGKREEEHESKDGDRIYAYERSYGTFTRAFTLPDNIDTDHIRTELQDGVLTLVVPKKAGAQPRKIQIGSGTKS